MDLTLIDNSFYRLTAAQARQLSIEKRLPRDGYEIKADPAALETVRLGKVDGRLGENGTWVEFPCKAKDAKEAWIKQTRLSWWDGKELPNGWTWALALRW